MVSTTCQQGIKSVYVLVIFFLPPVLLWVSRCLLYSLEGTGMTQVLTDLRLSGKVSDVMCKWGHIVVIILTTGTQ